VILTLTSVFIATTLLIIGIYWILDRKANSTQSQIKKQIDSFSKKKAKETSDPIPLLLPDDDLSQIPAFNRFLEKLNMAKKLHRLLKHADSKMRVGDLILLMMMFAGAGFLVTFFFPNILFKLIIFFGSGSIPLINIIVQRKKRLNAFIREFPDALDMMTSALKAGHALNQALQLVGNEAPDPVGIEFKRAFEQYNLGLNMREALLNMTERIESLDLKLFITAILLQRETGGNLTEILENIGYTIRERFKLIGQIRTFTAQGRMSAGILGTLPAIFLAIISVLNPGYLRPLFKDPLGHYFIVLAVVLQIIGFIIINKIVQIKYQ